MRTTPIELLRTYLDAVAEVDCSVEAKAEVVINLAKRAQIADAPLKQALAARLGSEAAEHPYFFWRPSPRFGVGETVRVVDGAPQILGKIGRITEVEDLRSHGARGMTLAQNVTVVFAESPDPWGFREEQLEPWQQPR